jgi:hypothetical protein
VLVVVWALAVPLAAVLGVLALRSAGPDSSATVLTPAQAMALANPGDGAPSAEPSPTPSTSLPSGLAENVERRVPGAVLGLRCEQEVPELAWSVPDAGWRVEQVEREDDQLTVRLEAGDDEVRVTVACADGVPTVVEAARAED